MSTFLILGGTGKVGSRLTHLVRATRHEARGANRTNGDVRFDWHDPATYGPALEGVEGVFLVGPGSATDWTDLLAPFLTRAEAVGDHDNVLRVEVEFLHRHAQVLSR